MPHVAGYEVVEYRYVVPDRFALRGHVREGARLRFGPVTALAGRRFVQTHPEGTELDVAVNPRNFDDAVLLPGISLPLSASTALGIVALTSGAFWLVAALLAPAA